jgi:hypothetical protein
MAASSSQQGMNNELSELVGQLSLEEQLLNLLNRQNRGARAAIARLGPAAREPQAAEAAAAQRRQSVINRRLGLQGRIAEMQQARQAAAMQQARQAAAALKYSRMHRIPHEENGFQQKKHRQTASTHNLVRRGPSANNDSEDEDEDDGGARASAHPRVKRGRPQGGAIPKKRSTRRNRRNTRKSKQTRRRHK